MTLFNHLCLVIKIKIKILVVVYFLALNILQTLEYRTILKNSRDFFQYSSRCVNNL